MHLLKRIASRLWRMKKWLLALMGLAYLIINEDNGLLAQQSIRKDIKYMEQELEKYKQQYEEDTKALEQLKNDPAAVERIARERYLMKREGEDIFIFPAPSDTL